MYQTRRLISLCPSCRALLGSLSFRRQGSSSFEPGKVLVVQKRSRLDYERARGNLSDDELHSKMSKIESDYRKMVEGHSVHHRSIDETLEFLQREGVPLRVVRSREDYNHTDVQWADTIFSLGGDGNFLYTASKVLSPDKLVIGLNTDPRSSEGYLCLPSSREHTITDTLEEIFRGGVAQTQRTRVRVCVGGGVLPVRALNEVYVGEKSLSQASSYELSFDDSAPERQKSSGVVIYTGTGSTSWAYNMNQLTSDQVISLISLAKEEGLVNNADREIVEKITRRYNAGNVFRGCEDKMAFVVREPIVKGLFAACRTHGYAQTVQLRSRSWYTCVIVDGDHQFDLPLGAVATCSLHEEDRLTTLDTTRTNDCFS